jgi:hypothetical protein
LGLSPQLLLQGIAVISSSFRAVAGFDLLRTSLNPFEDISSASSTSSHLERRKQIAASWWTQAEADVGRPEGFVNMIVVVGSCRDEALPFGFLKSAFSAPRFAPCLSRRRLVEVGQIQKALSRYVPN